MEVEVRYPLGKDMMYLKNKNYNMSALSYAMLNGKIDQESRYRVISEKEFFAALKEELKLSKYKCSVILDAILDAGIAIRSRKNLVFFYVTEENSLKLNISTVKYCLEHLNEFEFRTYCVLAYKYSTSKAYDNDMYYCLFSNKELLESIGYYAIDSDNLKRIKETLILLKTLKLIDYSEEFEAVMGKQGLYRRLYRVNQKFNEYTKNKEYTNG